MANSYSPIASKKFRFISKIFSLHSSDRSCLCMPMHFHICCSLNLECLFPTCHLENTPSSFKNLEFLNSSFLNSASWILFSHCPGENDCCSSLTLTALNLFLHGKDFLKRRSWEEGGYWVVSAVFSLIHFSFKEKTQLLASFQASLHTKRG